MDKRKPTNKRKRLYQKFAAERIVHRSDILDFYEGNTAQANLNIQRLLNSGKAIRVKTGVYYFKKADEFHFKELYINPWLIAGKVANDGVIAFHSALNLIGSAYSVSNVYQIGVPLTVKTIPGSFEFQQYKYQFYRVDTHFGIKQTVVEDIRIGHFSKERIILEGLMNPALFWGMSEFLQSIEGVTWINPDELLEMLSNYPVKTIAMRLGWLLEKFQEKWYIQNQVLSSLEKMKPNSLVFLVAGQRSGNRLVSRWNLMVPDSLLHLEEV